eukprot:GCRY01002624.1.p1 GENE.GCRY01002624.1~~GCRY01002624.1.p1  ORF type:complete len:462 (+),score=82.36 GCRY01002624.1:99-1484(+)
MGKKKKKNAVHPVSLDESIRIEEDNQDPSNEAIPFEPEELSIFIGTWNMHGKPPPEKLDPFLPSFFSSCHLPHVYAIGTEECEASIEKSMVFSKKGKWEQKLMELLEEDYVFACAHTLQAIHLALFLRKDIAPHIKKISSSHVVCGLGNIIANKGAVAIRFEYRKRSFLLINAHLAAHQNNAIGRNADYWRIISELSLKETDGGAVELGGSQVSVADFESSQIPADGAYDSESEVSGADRSPSNNPESPNESSCESNPSPLQPKEESPSSEDKGSKRKKQSKRSKKLAQSSTSSVLDKHHYVFFFGDLNYRVNGNRSIVDQLIAVSLFEVLLKNDQLSQVINSGAAFPGFLEGHITFPPTYKIDPGTVDSYDTSVKQRIPAWTDRILYKENLAKLGVAGREEGVFLRAYDSVPAITLSDHKPVYALFSVSLPPITQHQASSGYLPHLLAPLHTVTRTCSIL